MGTLAVFIFSAAMAIGRFVAAKLSQIIKIKLLMIFSAILGILVTVLLPVTSDIMIFFILLFLAGISISCFGQQFFH